MRGVAFCKRAKEFCFITCLHFYFTFVIIIIIIKQSQWPTESFQVCEFWIHRLRDRLNYQSIKIMIIRGQRKSSQISKFWVRATRKIHPKQLIQDQLFFDHKIKTILITVQRTMSNIWMSSPAMRPESHLNHCTVQFLNQDYKDWCPHNYFQDIKILFVYTFLGLSQTCLKRKCIIFWGGI